LELDANHAASLQREYELPRVSGSNILDGGNKGPRRFGKMPIPMPTVTESELRELRLRYNAAYAAYQSCLLAMNEAVMSGQAASSALLKNEAEALRELTGARGDLLAAMTAAANAQIYANRRSRSRNPPSLNTPRVEIPRA
jgi:hypothetical protein